MRDLTTAEMEIVGGGLVDISTGDINAANGVSAANGNSVASGNTVVANDNLSGNASGNSVDVAATVAGILGGLGL